MSSAHISTKGRSAGANDGILADFKVCPTKFSPPLVTDEGAPSSSRGVRSVSAERAVFTIETKVVTRKAPILVQGPGVGGVTVEQQQYEDAPMGPPPQVSVRAVSPAFKRLEPGVYVQSLRKVTAGLTDEGAPPPAYSRLPLRRSASREGSASIGQNQPAGAGVSKNQMLSLRPGQYYGGDVGSRCPSSAGGAPMRSSPLRHRSPVVHPRVAAPRIDPTVQPTSYRRSVSSEAVPYSRKVNVVGRTANVHPHQLASGRQARGQSADGARVRSSSRSNKPAVVPAQQPKKNQKKKQPPQTQQQQQPLSLGQKGRIGSVTMAVGTHNHHQPSHTQKRFSDAISLGSYDELAATTVPTAATTNPQQKQHPGRLDYSDDDEEYGGEAVLPPKVLLVPNMAFDTSSFADNSIPPSNVSTRNDAANSRRNLSDEEKDRYNEEEQQQAAAKATGRKKVAVMTPAQQNDIARLQSLSAPTANFAARKRIAHNQKTIEVRDVRVSKEEALCQRYNCSDAVSFQHCPPQYLTVSHQRSVNGGGGAISSATSAAGGAGVGIVSARSRSSENNRRSSRSPQRHMSRAVSPDINISQAYRGRSESIDNVHAVSRKRSVSCDNGAAKQQQEHPEGQVTTTQQPANRVQDIEDRLRRFSQHRHQTRQQAAQNYISPAELMQSESPRRNQLPRNNSATADSSPLPADTTQATPTSQSLSPPTRSAPESPSKLVPLVSSKSLASKSFEQSPQRDRNAEMIKAEMKNNFKRLIRVGPEGDRLVSARSSEPASPNNRTTIIASPSSSPPTGRASATLRGSNAEKKNSPPLESSPPATLMDFEHKKQQAIELEKTRTEEDMAAARREESMRVAYDRMKTPLAIPERIPIKSRDV